jgi:hypothetical protein
MTYIVHQPVSSVRTFRSFVNGYSAIQMSRVQAALAVRMVTLTGPLLNAGFHSQVLV